MKELLAELIGMKGHPTARSWLTAVGPGLYRVALVWCQAATLLITWPLWQVHRSPPMLPAVGLPPLDLAPMLLFSLVMVLMSPVRGMLIHTALIAYAVLADQTRLQPEVISLVILLWGSLPYAGAKTIARTHLVALWFFAGLNKLLSPGFHVALAPALLAAIAPQAPEWLSSQVGLLIALTEMSVGVAAVVPATRRIAAVGAFCLGAGTLVELMFGLHGNVSVWPWNAALAVSGFALILPWRGCMRASLAVSPVLIRIACVALLVTPVGFYVGRIDAYLAHNLYTANTATATSTAFSTDETWAAFNVPLPPEHRLFHQWFVSVCQEGDTLTIRDPRWWYEMQGRSETLIRCAPTLLPAPEPHVRVERHPDNPWWTRLRSTPSAERP